MKMEVGDLIKCKRGSNEIIHRVKETDDILFFVKNCDSVEVIEKASKEETR